MLATIFNISLKCSSFAETPSKSGEAPLHCEKADNLDRLKDASNPYIVAPILMIIVVRIIINALGCILWVGGTHVEEAPDSLRRCQTTSTLRFPNNNSPHFAPNLRHIYSFNLSSRILWLSGLPAPRHNSGMTPREDQKTPKEPEKRGTWIKSLKKEGSALEG